MNIIAAPPTCPAWCSPTDTDHLDDEAFGSVLHLACMNEPADGHDVPDVAVVLYEGKGPAHVELIFENKILGFTPTEARELAETLTAPGLRPEAGALARALHRAADVLSAA